MKTTYVRSASLNTIHVRIDSTGKLACKRPMPSPHDRLVGVLTMGPEVTVCKRCKKALRALVDPA